MGSRGAPSRIMPSTMRSHSALVLPERVMRDSAWHCTQDSSMKTLAAPSGSCTSIALGIGGIPGRPPAAAVAAGGCGVPEVAGGAAPEGAAGDAVDEAAGDAASEKWVAR